MLECIFLLFIVPVSSLHPSQLSPKYRERINFEDLTFRCFNDDRTISIYALNNGSCNCCDGYDQFWHEGTYCRPTCPHHFSPNQKNHLRNDFMKAIQIRNTLVDKYNRESLTFTSRVDKLNKQLTFLTDEFQNLTEQIQDADSNLHQWVYEINEMVQPDPQQLENEKQIYLNKIENIGSLNPAYHEIDEIGEDDDVRIDQREFNVRRRHRELKWEAIQTRSFQKLLDSAVAKSTPKDAGFLGKLKTIITAPHLPEPYATFLSLLEKRNETKQSISSTKLELQNSIEARDQDYGPNGVWIDAWNQTISFTIEDSGIMVDVQFLKFNEIRIPLDSRISRKHMNSYYLEQGRIEYFDGDPAPDGMTYSMRFQLVCYPQLKVFGSSLPVVSRILAVVGLPEACDAEYSDDAFQAYLNDLEPFRAQFADDDGL